MNSVVKCPICNAKIAFSLPMHMHMVHGPGIKIDDSGETPNDSEPSNGAMNQMRPIQPPKRPGRGRRGAPRGGTRGAPPRRRRK